MERSLHAHIFCFTVSCVCCFFFKFQTFIIMCLARVWVWASSPPPYAWLTHLTDRRKKNNKTTHMRRISIKDIFKSTSFTVSQCVPQRIWCETFCAKLRHTFFYTGNWKSGRWSRKKTEWKRLIENSKRIIIQSLLNFVWMCKM